MRIMNEKFSLYFEAELNPQFLVNYYRGDLGKRMAEETFNKVKD